MGSSAKSVEELSALWLEGDKVVKQRAEIVEALAVKSTPKELGDAEVPSQPAAIVAALIKASTASVTSLTTASSTTSSSSTRILTRRSRSS